MDKNEVLIMLDKHKNKLIDPIEMLNWIWLRVFIMQIPDDQWDFYMNEVQQIMSK